MTGEQSTADTGDAAKQEKPFFEVVGGNPSAVEVGILEGVTRAEIFEVAKAEGMPVEERYLLPIDLLHADEAMITSSVREIVPVVRVGIDDEEHPIGSGTVGPVVKRITAAFRAHARRSVGLG